MLENLVVVELASVLAGPSVGLFFEELGAKVIKIENKKSGGDMTRTWKQSGEDPDAPVSAYYSAINWKKEVHMLDLTTAEDQNIVHEMVKEADVVISNFKPGSGEKLSMDPKSLKALNPKLIYAHVAGFGSADSRTAFDVVLQAETGLMYMNGTPESGPVRLPVAMIDILAAHQLKQGILLALLQRAQTGKGALVTANLEAAGISCLANQATNWLMNKTIPQAIGSEHPNIAPYGEILVTKDQKQIVLAVGTDQQFKSMCAVLEQPDLAADPRFATNPQRVANRLALKQLLQNLFVNWNRNDLIQAFIQQDVPAGAIKNLAEVFDERTAKKYVLRSQLEGRNTQRVKTVGFKINAL